MSVENSSAWYQATNERIPSDDLLIVALIFFVLAVIAFRPWRYAERSDQISLLRWAFRATVAIVFLVFLGRWNILPGGLLFFLSGLVYVLVFFMFSDWGNESQKQADRLLGIMLLVIIVLQTCAV